jgi:hypothetical protein
MNKSLFPKFNLNPSKYDWVSSLVFTFAVKVTKSLSLTEIGNNRTSVLSAEMLSTKNWVVD